MQHVLFASLAEMLAPATLAQLTGLSITDVHCAPLNTEGGYSGSSFWSITIHGEPGVRLVLKRMSLASDYTMWASDDQRGRAVNLWRCGVFDRLPPEIEHATIACARDGVGWAILMWDVAPHLLQFGPPLEAEELETVIDALAALHAAFWGDETLKHPDLGLVDVRKLLLAASPATALAAPHTGSPIAKMVLDGWELLPRLLPADAYGLLCDLLNDPQPLLDALAPLPRTLLHGDYRRGNLGLRRTPQPRVIVLDWTSAAYAAPAIDLSWLMYLPSHSALPLEKAAARYRQKLEQRLGATFEDSAWERQMALGLLFNAARTAVYKAFFSALDNNPFAQQDVADLQIYAEQIRQGVRWL